MAGQLQDRVAVVTGGTSGIGRAIAGAFAEQGACVAIAGRDESRGKAAMSQIRGAGGRAVFVEADVSDVAATRAMAQDVLGEFGRLDILVNCAGVFPLGPTTEVTEEEFDQAVSVNVKGVFFATQAVLPHMLASGSGKIINLASTSALTGFAGAAVYCATKGAILMMTKAWAVEYAPHGINVNAIAPATIETPMNAKLRAEQGFEELVVADTPAGRIGQVEDVTPAAVFLAGDGASFIHGDCLLVDGGWVAR